MDFLALQGAVMQDRFDATAYRERVKGWLNDGAGRIARRADLPRLRTTVPLNLVTGESEYDLPIDHARTVRVLYLDYPEEGGLRFEDDPAVVRRMRGDSCRPEYYSIESGKLIVGPVPDRDYPLEQTYQRLPVRMGDDADVPELPEDYHDLCVTYAVSRGFRAEDDFEAARNWMQDFESDLAGLKVDLRTESVDGPVQVPGTF